MFVPKELLVILIVLSLMSIVVLGIFFYIAMQIQCGFTNEDEELERYMNTLVLDKIKEDNNVRRS